MYSVLLVISAPKDSDFEGKATLSKFFEWASTQHALDKPEIRLAKNVLLFPLKSELVAFSYMITRLQEAKLSYRTLFFEDKPDWIYSAHS